MKPSGMKGKSKEMNMKTNALIAATVLGLCSLSSKGFAETKSVDLDKKVFITIDADSVGYTTKKFGSRAEHIETIDGISVVKIDESALPWLSMLMHKDYKRCGGFMLHEDEAEASLQANSVVEQAFAKSSYFAINYKIDQQAVVKPLVDQLKADNILQNITKMSSFQNRYYKGDSGKNSAAWIKDTWTSLVKNRSDATVEYFKHTSWDQPSVILTIKGKTNEIVVLGGHQDSINGYFGGSTARAPGADDNASGISTITEVIRVLSENNYQPTKTLKFMAYAAEEVGLLGSKEIATKFKNDGANVVGVMQLDMTNFKGTSTLDIVMMTDYTNEEQNKFVGSIIDTYVPGVKWGYDQCGYGCSDHASWTTQGYPASMPFEAKMNDMNHNIHTDRDTLKVSNNNADHAVKFAKMALAFVVELGK
jgi:leucyl aminopeptidase